MLIVIIGWIFFAIDDISLAQNYLLSMFGKGNNPLWDSAGIYYLTSYAVFFIIMIVLSSQNVSSLFVKPDIKSGTLKKQFGIILHLAILVLSTAYLITETYNPFLYFRF